MRTRKNYKICAFNSKLAACLSSLTILLANAYAQNAYAGSATANLGITSSVVTSCTISAPTPVAFGSYTGALVQGQGALSVNCTNSGPYTISLDAGTGSGATVAARKMTAGSFTLNYGLYTSNTYSTIWGDGTNGTSTVPGTGIGSAQSVTVYGQIPTSQTLNVGSYSDTVVATISF